MRGSIVLASASPRRRDLLANAGVEFEVRPADVDEELAEFESPTAAARLLAERKARACAGELTAAGPPGSTKRTWVLAADTVVAVLRAGTWELLGKAADEREAHAMLAGLSGTRHVVVTGVALLVLPEGELRSEVEETYVTMRPLAPEEVAAYVATGEWRDKAGGYAIQESADAFVERLEGRFDNVVGLPVERTLEMLRDAGALAPGS